MTANNDFSLQTMSRWALAYGPSLLVPRVYDFDHRGPASLADVKTLPKTSAKPKTRDLGLTLTMTSGQNKACPDLERES